MLFVIRGLSAIALQVGGYAKFLYLSGDGGGTGFFVGAGTLVTRVAFASGSPNHVAGFPLLFVPFAAAVLYRGPGRLLDGLALVLSVVGVYVTFSRAALIAVAVIPLFFIPAALVGDPRALPDRGGPRQAVPRSSRSA